MKLKTIDVNGTTYAEVRDGKPVFLHGGKEVPFDAAEAMAKISSLEKRTAEFDTEKLANAFVNSKFIKEKLTLPVDMVQATFGGRFKNEDGKLAAYEPAGGKMYSRTRPGELAEFDEALERIIDAYPYRDTILKASGASGGGTGPLNPPGDKGAKVLTRAEFDKLDPMARAQKMKDGFKISD
jgi:hypothetical protein